MTKAKKKEISGYIFSSLFILGFSLLFSLFSMIFLMIKTEGLTFAASFIFIAPTVYITYSQGKSYGERLYKSVAQTSLSDIHGERGVRIPYYRCIFHVLGFVAPLTIIFVISVILKSTGLRLVGMIFEFPVALMFSAFGPLKLDVVTPLTLAVFLPYTFILAGVFSVAYILKIYQLKNRYAEIKSEIRSFDN